MPAVLSRALPKKKALLIAIQHIRCKVGSEFAELRDLPFAHRDAEALRDFLIAFHGYQSEDIILMKDDPSHPEYLWPTRKKILYQLNQLTSNVPEGCHITFYYSGHGIEEVCSEEPDTRADREDDEIISADGKKITDHDLHDHLIEPLEKVKGAKLFTLLDSCTSETLLNLQMCDTPNHYGREWKFGRDELFKVIVNTIIVFSSKKHSEEERFTIRRRASIKLSSPRVPKTREIGGLSVICLSACRDRQFAHDVGGETFTQCFLDAVRAKPEVTWAELRDALRTSVSRIQERWEARLHRPCRQDPRYCTTRFTDLTEPVML